MTNSKIAFITGANRGLGFEIGRQLGKLKMKVLLGARNEKRGQEAAIQLTSEGIDAEYIPIDITDNKSITDAASIVKNKFGRLDILINNAVFFNRENQSPSIISPGLLQNYMNTNFIGHVLVTQAFLPLLPCRVSTPSLFA
jgi:NAD(P)-dependent dehydrogenase (short-subunit alcohol dehydrogenase family)